MHNKNEEGNRLALDADGNIISFRSSRKSKSNPEIQELPFGSHLVIDRRDGIRMVTRLDGLFMALESWRAQDLDDLQGWMESLFEYGLLNDEIPHVRLSELKNMINSLALIIAATYIDD